MAIGNYIKKCVNKAKIEGRYSAAGLVRKSYDMLVTECGNEGEIICHGGDYAAGITVEFSNSINKCYNTGKITNEGGGIRGAAGICAFSWVDSKKITNCYNTADIISMTGNAGGMICWSNTIIQNCYNSGSISGNSGWHGGVARN